MSVLPPRMALCRQLCAEIDPDAGPRSLPAIAAGNPTERKHGRDVVPRPVHPTPFQARLHHQLAGALGDPAANRIALPLEGRVGQLLAALMEVTERGAPD